MKLVKNSFFSVGFRPFFLFASVYSILTIVLWAGVYGGYVNVVLWEDMALWHGFEMVYGYTLAIVAGFLLTAVPNWTKGKYLAHWGLVGLCGIGLLGRMAMWCPLPAWLGISINALFPLAMAGAIIGPLLLQKSWRNLPFVGILAILTLLSTTVQLEGWYGATWLDARTALNAAVVCILLMITIIGGRIIPLFTANAYKVKGKEYEKFLTPLVNRSLNLLMAAWGGCGLLLGFNAPLAGGVALVAGGLHAYRFFGWQNHITHWQWPLVWILHIGYFWLVLGMIWYGGAVFAPELPSYLALHILTLGCIGTLTVGMMTRVSLGHTGRELRAPTLIVFGYFVLQAAIVVRCALPVVYGEHYMSFVIASSVLWALVHALFLITFYKIFLKPRRNHE